MTFSTLPRLGALLLVFLPSFAGAQNAVPIQLPADSYAGIEVGSKGVKMSVISVGQNAATTGMFTAIADTATNTDFISFTPKTFAATLDGLTGLYNTAVNKYGLPADKIYTVVSSGVKGQAEKDDKKIWIANLADSFRARIGEPGRKVAVVDVVDEARLSHLGIVPESRRYNTFLIDIGSGNTKGGYFHKGNTKDLRLFTLSWGTKSVSNATDKRLDEDKSTGNYKKQLQRVIAGEPEAEVVYAVNESGAYNMNDYFAFSGGIAWATATLLYPELSENSVVPLSFADLMSFNERLVSNYTSLTPEALTANLTGSEKESVAKEIARVHKVFDQRSLMAGAALLTNIVRQFEGTWEKKQFFLVKNGQVGWISAYVNQSVKKQ